MRLHADRRTFRMLAGVAATALGLSGLTVAVTARPAAAAVTVNEVYPVQAGGTFSLDGHGWGHGHGLSQYGAQGGASLGKTADQITSFYYPNTARATLPNTLIRVLLQARSETDSQLYPATGLTVTDLASGTKATLPSGPTRWRAVTDAAGLHVQSYSGSWAPLALGGKTVVTGPIQFGGPPSLRLGAADGSSREYRGALRVVRLSATAVESINVLPLDSYLMGVVPRESSSSWMPAALQAQSIAARSYSAYKRAHAPSTQAFDICDTTMCQVYGGVSSYSASGIRTVLEATSTNDAVRQTAGVVRTYQGQPIFAEFCSSNGGWSTDGGQPYLVAQRDDWDGAVYSTVHSWTATVTAAQLQARFPSVGTLKSLRITGRDGNGEWGGRVKTVVLEGVNSAGAATSVTTTGAGVYYAHTWPASSDGLRGTWWTVRAPLNNVLVSQSVAPSLVRSPGVSRGALSVMLRNTGSATWTMSAMKMVLSSSPGSADPLVGGSTAPGRYAGTASTVGPGQTAVFGFALTGDGVAPGVQARSYRLSDSSGHVFGATATFRVPVAAPAFVGASVGPPVSLAARPAAVASDQPGPVFADGHTVVVPVVGSTALRLSVKNGGNVAWPTSGVRLGVSGPRAPVDGGTSPSVGPEWLSKGRPVALGGSSAVAPGGTGTFDVTLHGNGHPLGVSNEIFEPVWDGQHWIDGAVRRLAVVRVDPSRARQAVIEVAPRALSLLNAPTGTATVRLRLRNVGGGAWDVGYEALAATATPLATSAWTGAGTPPALAANISRPGHAKVYPGEVGEWQVPLSAAQKAAGTYNITLQPQGPTGRYGPATTFTVQVTSAVFTGTLVRVAPVASVPSMGTGLTWFDIKNTGNVAWPLNAAIQSAVLTRGGSPSVTRSWLTVSRPSALRSNLSRPGTNLLAPGEIGRFAFALGGNGRTPRTGSERFGVVWQGWLPLPGIAPPLPYRVI